MNWKKYIAGTLATGAVLAAGAPVVLATESFADIDFTTSATTPDLLEVPNIHFGTHDVSVLGLGDQTLPNIAYTEGGDVLELVDFTEDGDWVLRTTMTDGFHNTGELALADAQLSIREAIGIPGVLSFGDGHWDFNRDFFTADPAIELSRTFVAGDFFIDFQINNNNAQQFIGNTFVAELTWSFVDVVENQ